MERVAVTPTPNRFVSLLIDEYDNDWNLNEVHSPGQEVEDDAATLRQSSPVEPTLPHSQEPDDAAQGDLGNALRQVAAALASDNVAAADPFAALRRFCSSPTSSRSARSSLGPNEDWDREASEFLNLLVRQQNLKSGRDDCIDPLLLAVEKMEHRRLSLDPNWKLRAHKAAEIQEEPRRRSEGFASQLPVTARSTQEVDLPLLPPCLAGASNTPLKDKDAFTRSTPPLPVRGAADRQAYLQNRVSTQKLAERITRATRLEEARRSVEMPVDEEEPVSLRSPTFGQEPNRESSIASSSDQPPTSPLVILSSSKDVQPPSPAVPEHESSFQSPQTRETRPTRPSGIDMEVVVPELGSPAVQDAPPAATVRRLSLGRAAVKSKAKKAPPSVRSAKSAVDSTGSSPFTETVSVQEKASENQPPPPAQNKRGSKAKAKPAKAREGQRGSLSKSKESQQQQQQQSLSKSKESQQQQQQQMEEVSDVAEDAALSLPEPEGDSIVEAEKDDESGECLMEVGGDLRQEEEEGEEVGAREEENELVEVGAGSIMSPSWTTPRPAECTALVIVEDVGKEVVALDDSAERRRSMGVQVSGKAKAAARRRPPPALLLPLESKEGHLRRISICEAEDDKEAVPGKIVRQRSKRIRIAPLAWWAGEHIEYSAVEGDPCKAKATAVYKVEVTAPSKRKKPSQPLAIDNRPASSTSANKRTHPRKRSRSSADATEQKRTIDRKLFQDQTLGEQWVADIEDSLGRTLKTSTFIDDKEEVMAVRPKEESWVPVSQNGYSYSVRLLLQTIRNTSVEFKLEPGRSKGQDQTRATQILLSMASGEDLKLVVETWREGGDREKKNLGVGDWLLIPPKSFYDVANSSRTRSCVILAHVIACDNELFKGFVNSDDMA